MWNFRNLVWSSKSRTALESHPSSTPHVGPAEGHHIAAIASSSRCCPVLSPTERSAGRPCTTSFLYTLLPLKALLPRNPVQKLTLAFSVLFHRKSVTHGNRQENAMAHLFDFQHFPLSCSISGAQRNDLEMTNHDYLLFQSCCTVMDI